MSATGYLFDNLPAGPERDLALGLVRIGLAFKTQQRGRRPDCLTKYITGLVQQLPQSTLTGLLERLDVEAARRDKFGERSSPVEKLDRVWHLLTWHHPRRGRIHVPFGTLKKKLTAAKKTIKGG